MEDKREAIIEAAVELGGQQGLAAISARGVARKAGVSVGYLYKLFPSKSDIVVAAATRYFEHAFFDTLCRVDSSVSYLEFCRDFCRSAEEAVATFRSDWLKDVEDLPHADLVASRLRMSATLEHAQRGLVTILDRDPAIAWDALPPDVEADSIAAFTLKSIVGSIQAGKNGCAVLLALLERGLY